MTEITTAKMKEKARRNFEMFSKVTHMHGFHEIYHAKACFWRFLWIAIVVAAIALTIYQVYRATLQFTTATGLTLIQPLDTGLMLPPLSMCYYHWMSWVDWKKAESLNFTKESLLYGFSYLTPIFSPMVFNTTEAKQTLLKTMQMHNMSTMSEFYTGIVKMLPMVMGKYDKARLVNETPFFNEVEFRMKDGDIYLCYKVDGDDILNITMASNNSADPFASSTSKNIFNYTTQDFKYYRMKQYVSEDEYSFNVAYYVLTRTNYWFEHLDEFTKNFTGFPFPYRIYPDSYSDKYVDVSSENDCYTIAMTPTAHRWLSTDEHPCEDNQKRISTNSSCEDKCRADYRNKLKMCLPLDTAVLLGLDIPERLCQQEIYFIPTLFERNNQFKNLSFSDLFNYADPFDGTIPDTIDNETRRKLDAELQDCKSKCVRACETWDYLFTSTPAVQPASIRDLSFANQTDVNIIYPNENSVLVVIEEKALTWEDYIANVGGLLGIWTGASVLSFLQVVYLCCFYENSCSCFTRTVHPLKRKITEYVKPVDFNTSNNDVKPKQLKSNGQQKPDVPPV